MTVRRAIRILVDEGRSATRGRGTFVEAASIASAAFDLGSFRALLADPAVDVRMLAVGIRARPAASRRMLEVADGTRVIRIRRLLFRDGRPFFYHREWLTYDPRRPTVATGLGVTALSDLFEGRGQTGPKRGRLTLEATVLRKDEARNLGATAGEAAFLLEHHFNWVRRPAPELGRVRVPGGPPAVRDDAVGFQALGMSDDSGHAARRAARRS